MPDLRSLLGVCSNAAHSLKLRFQRTVAMFPFLLNFMMHCPNPLTEPD
jgi:hypothetical protein